MRRFSASDRLAKGRGSWKLRASPRRVRWWADSPSSASSAKRTLPLSLRKVPQMQFTRVDLPEPFGPIRPSRSPCCTSRSIDSRATKPPKALAETRDFQQRRHRFLWNRPTMP